MKKDQDKGTVKNVDEYLKALPQDVRATLENLRNIIKTTAPLAEEVISYQIPTYRYHGALVHFMAHKNYCSFFVVNKSILETFKDELKDYESTGTTIHFTVKNPLPRDLVEKIVKERIRQNELNMAHN
ncbi:MAG: hypothetical protein AMQ22_00800 [Candidatus Methanofastidiosum methylothiophilum]|uniref:YdhG-like domain-containing protein n=1 Tax=Candidatus Methanofastidiosum methylothiophilum TaxID=1705564 RepID=A0A150J649_9EURY|nr:MAG: hypothetical protein AMQ22_00800 [Candidatus Methanofastidiosum methylthiophilus]